MTLDELIKNGLAVAANNRIQGSYKVFIKGLEYEEWLALAIRFVKFNFPADSEAIRFRQIAEIANGNSEKHFHKLIAILKAFTSIPQAPISPDIMPLIKDICTNFNKFDTKIRRRYGDRNTIEIKDEHDLQDCLEAILRLFVNDIRPEDYVPSYAGGNSRVDFLLPDHGIIIEIKMTRNTLKDSKIGEELIVDIERYKQLQGYSTLVCFIYDKDSHINNPHGLIKDLEKLSDDKLNVKIFISPL